MGGGGGYVHMSADAQRSHKRELDSLELELEVVVSHSTWVLRT